MKQVGVFVMVLFLLLPPSSAHPGKTDANGGHYNRSTGEYHYHHGFPEHQHENGICPYDYEDKTEDSHGMVTIRAPEAPFYRKGDLFMSEQEYRIMVFMRECRHCSRTDLLNSFIGEMDINEANLLLQALSKRKWISMDFDMNAEITPRGLSALLIVEEEKRKQEAQRAENQAKERAAEAKRLKERAEDRADQERRYRGQNRVTIGAAFISFFLGMIVEHFSGILGFLVHCFQ